MSSTTYAPFFVPVSDSNAGQDVLSLAPVTMASQIARYKETRPSRKEAFWAAHVIAVRRFAL